jgi:fimbrial isopeptide formation D2 family protein/LPXTG-motif cell wall-anchored protein
LAEDTKGTINISSGQSNNTYTIYRVLDLVSYDADKGAYLYQATEPWLTFINAYNTDHAYQGSETGKPITMDANGYITSVSLDEVTFAKEALQYAEEQGIANNGQKQSDESGNVTFEGLELGYYLVDSGLGTLLALATTNPTVTITDKNEVPTVEKMIVLGDARDSVTTATIGDTISFRTKITAQKGAESYVLHDMMDKGLTFHEDTLSVVEDNNTVLTSGKEYNVLPGGTKCNSDKCTFEIEFTEAFNALMATESKVFRVFYSATLNTDAQVVVTAAATRVNTNSTYLSYGKGYATAVSKVTVKTFRYQIIKVDSDYNVLSGAEFQLYRDAEAKEPIKFTVMTDEDGNTEYRVDPNGEVSAIEAGKPVIYGLGNGTYYLEETKAPAGYNRVTELKTITVSDSSHMGAFTDDAKTIYDSGTGGGIAVVNKAGTLLPTTGGSGTIFIYIGGTLLVAVGCLLLLKWRKREKIRNSDL